MLQCSIKTVSQVLMKKNRINYISKKYDILKEKLIGKSSHTNNDLFITISSPNFETRVVSPEFMMKLCKHSQF